MKKSIVSYSIKKHINLYNKRRLKEFYTAVFYVLKQQCLLNLSNYLKIIKIIKKNNKKIINNNFLNNDKFFFKKFLNNKFFFLSIKIFLRKNLSLFKKFYFFYDFFIILFAIFFYFIIEILNVYYHFDKIILSYFF